MPESIAFLGHNKIRLFLDYKNVFFFLLQFIFLYILHRFVNVKNILFK